MESITIEKLKIQIVLRTKLTAIAQDMNVEHRMGLGWLWMVPPPGSEVTVPVERNNFDIEMVSSNLNRIAERGYVPLNHEVCRFDQLTKRAG